MEAVEIIDEQKIPAKYDGFRAELSKLKEKNKNTIFDIETSKGEKDARSYVAKLRKSKTAIEEHRKKLKAPVLAAGKKIDAEAELLKSEVDDMIDVQMKPLNEKKEREEKRIKALKQKVAYISGLGGCAHNNREQCERAIAALNEMDIDESFEEFRPDAMVARDDALKALKNRIEIVAKDEELEAMRKKMAEMESSIKKSNPVPAASPAPECPAIKPEKKDVRAIELEPRFFVEDLLAECLKVLRSGSDDERSILIKKLESYGL